MSSLQYQHRICSTSPRDNSINMNSYAIDKLFFWRRSANGFMKIVPLSATSPRLRAGQGSAAYKSSIVATTFAIWQTSNQPAPCGLSAAIGSSLMATNPFNSTHLYTQKVFPESKDSIPCRAYITHTDN